MTRYQLSFIGDHSRGTLETTNRAAAVALESLLGQVLGVKVTTQEMPCPEPVNLGPELFPRHCYQGSGKTYGALPAVLTRMKS